jgi:hypothetical protein
MKLYIHPISVNGAVEVTTDFNFKIENNGNTLYNSTPTNPVNSNVVMYDNNGLALTCNLNTTVDYVLYCDIPFYNPWDSVDIKITISKTGYTTYSQTFTLYSIDTELDIRMVIDSSVANETDTATSIVYIPFTDKAYIYRTSNKTVDSISYLSSTGDSLLSSANGEITISEDDTMDIVVVHNSTSTTYTKDIYAYNYFPDFSYGYICESNCGDCPTVIADSRLDITIDTSLLSHLDVDGSTRLDGLVDWHTVYGELINMDGSIVVQGEESSLVVDSEVISFDDFNIVRDDPHVLRVCYSIYGEFPVIEDGEIPIGYYRVLSADGVDFSNLTISGSVANFQNIEVTVGGTPTDWGNGRIIPIYNINNVSSLADGSYRVFDNTGVTINGNVTVVGQVINYDSSIDTLAIAGNGYIVQLGEVYECCQTETIEPCELYDIVQSGCNAYTIYNRSFATISFIVYQLDSSKSQTWTEVQASTNIPQQTDVTINLSQDGVYKVDITDANGAESKIIVNACNIETCYLDYLNKIQCCNPDTNCDDDKDGNCIEKDFYNFNAFRVLVDSFYAILNYNYDITESYTNFTDEQISTYYELNDLLSRAAEYCVDCKDCDEV